MASVVYFGVVAGTYLPGFYRNNIIPRFCSTPAPVVLPRDFDFRVQEAVKQALERRQRWTRDDWYLPDGTNCRDPLPSDEPWNNVVWAHQDLPSPRRVPKDIKGFSRTLASMEEALEKLEADDDRRKQVCDTWNKMAPETRMEKILHGQDEDFRKCRKKV
jgi:hypothetical protein